MAGDDRAQTRREFREAVNMTRAELRRWLDTAESRSVGATPSGERVSSPGAQSVGHASGRRIVDILSTRVGDMDDEDYRHMRKVIGYVRRHLAQRPNGRIGDSRWRRSLMNWGHDPLNG
jgi:hypothetical protein